MAPFIVMLVVWLVARSIGATGLWLHADSWTNSLRIALAAMFVFIAVSHFHPMDWSSLARSTDKDGFSAGGRAILDYWPRQGLVVHDEIARAHTHCSLSWQPSASV
jgi:hypothetical protein